MSDNGKGLKWKVSLTIIGFIAAILAGIYILKQSKDVPKGCFDFNDGSVQNWSLLQLYDTYSGNFNPITVSTPSGSKTQPVFNILTPFKLSNHQNIALEARSGKFLITDNSIKSVDIYFASPNLNNDPNWQNISGYSLDVRREYTGSCGDAKSIFKVQLQAKITDKQNTSHWMSGKDNLGSFIFHDLPLAKPTPLKWEWGSTVTLGGVSYSNSEFTVDTLRIRFTMPGYISTGECAYSGSFKIGNVCPIK